MNEESCVFKMVKYDSTMRETFVYGSNDTSLCEAIYIYNTPVLIFLMRLLSRISD